MLRIFPGDERKKLAFRFLLQHADYRKRCLYLQEIIGMGRQDDLWRRALLAYLDTPLNLSAFRPPGKN